MTVVSGTVRQPVPAALSGQRLDRVVALLVDGSRGQAAELVSAGSVTVDGAVVTSRSHRVADGEIVEVAVPEPEASGIVPDPDVALTVLYEDDDLVVVDKPADLVVHPGAGRSEGTLVHGLLARYPEVAPVGAPDRPGIVHRLDRGTSGLLLVARSAAAYEALVAMLASRRVERRYRALVWGQVESDTGLVDAPIGRSSGDRTRMAVTARGRPATTRYEVLRRFVTPVTATEVACTLGSGRTHQIRVHLASIGHPVVGDGRYGGRRSGVFDGPGRPWLHAEHLSLAHPTTGAALSFASPLPADLVAARARLG